MPQTVQTFLTRVYTCWKQFQAKQALNPRWNVFYALGKTTYEKELLHSYFIHILLKTKLDGKFVFLKLFTDLLNEKFQFALPDPSVDSCWNIQTEYDIGPITKNYLSGGRIDVLLQNKNHTLIIENKIWAEDQPKQLFRYYRKFPQARLMYLTLDGREPDVCSLHTLVQAGGSYYCLSYREDILAWLHACENACRRAVCVPPAVEMAVAQYRELVEDLTGQGETGMLKKELADIVVATEENFRSALQIYQNFTDIQNQLVRSKILLPLTQFIREQYGPEYQVQPEFLKKKNKKPVLFGFSIVHPSWRQIKLRFNGETYAGFTGLFGISSQDTPADARIFAYFNPQNFPSNTPSRMWPLIYNLDYPLHRQETLFCLYDRQKYTQLLIYYKEKINELFTLVNRAKKQGIVL